MTRTPKCHTEDVGFCSVIFIYLFTHHISCSRASLYHVGIEQAIVSNVLTRHYSTTSQFTSRSLWTRTYMSRILCLESWKWRYTGCIVHCTCVPGRMGAHAPVLISTLVLLFALPQCAHVQTLLSLTLDSWIAETLRLCQLSYTCSLAIQREVSSLEIDKSKGSWKNPNIHCASITGYQ